MKCPLFLLREQLFPGRINLYKLGKFQKLMNQKEIERPKTEKETRKMIQWKWQCRKTLKKREREIKRVSVRSIHYFSAANFGKLKFEVVGILMMLQHLQIVESHQIAAIGGLHSNTVKVHHFLTLLHCCCSTTESTNKDIQVCNF